MTNIMKSLLLLASAAMLILSTACKDRDSSSEQELGADGQIRLGVAGDLVTTKSSGVITDIKQLTENVAVYANTFRVIDGKRVMTWPTTPLIGTNVATVNTTATDPKELGELIYYTNKPTPFPEQYTLVYALFPSVEAAGVKMSYTAGNGPYDDPATVEKGGPKSEVTLKTKADEQYDILYATIPDLRREQLMNKQKAEIVFNHTLAQLKFKIYGETSLSGPLKLTKVVVNADSKGKLVDMSGDYTSVGTPVDMTMYDGAAIDLPITATVPANENVPASLMLFPSVEMASIKSITLTINDQQYKLDIKTPGFNLEKGKINIVTLKMTPLGLKLADVAAHTIKVWSVGGENNGNTNVVNYKTALSLKLQNSKVITGTSYTSSGSLTAEVQINDAFWLEHTNVDMTKTKLIPCNLTNGVLSFKEQEPTLMLNDDPIYLTHLKIYDNGTLIFDATATKGEILIPKTATGALEYVSRPNTTMMVNVMFGGFGEGSKQFPYLIQSLNMLKRLSNFTSSSALAIDNLHFKQTANFDLQNTWTAVGTATEPFYGSYDGGGFTLENLKVTGVVDGGLFGTVGQGTGAAMSEFANIKLASGSVTATTNAGALIGNLLGKATFTKVYNSGVTVTGPYAGGLVGNTTAAAISTAFKECSNTAVITSNGSSTSAAAGGIIGNDAASLMATFDNCHNTGDISTVYYGGGIAGRIGLNASARSLYQCSNKAKITGRTTSSSTGNKIGGLVGSIEVNNSVATTIQIQQSFNSGAITGAAAQLGGLVGYLNSPTHPALNITVQGCYNTGVVSVTTPSLSPAAAEDGVGGLFGYVRPIDAATVTIQNSYMAAEVQAPTTVRAAYLIGYQRATRPALNEVTATYFHNVLPLDADRDKYGPTSGQGTLPSTDLRVQAGVDLLNTGTTYFKFNAGGFPKLLWEK